MFISKDRIALLLWNLLILSASPVQAASFVFSDSAVVHNEGDGNGSTTIFGVPSTTPASSTSTAGYTSATVPGLAASGHAQAVFGALHSNAFSAIANPGFGLTSQARGQGSSVWADQVTISSPILTGPAFATALFSLSGALDSISGAPGAIANSTIAAAVRVNNALVFSSTGQLVAQNGVITTNDMDRGQAFNGVFQSDPVSGLTGTFSFDIPFAFGAPFEMRAELTAFTQAVAGASGDTASASSNFGSSGLWGGISGVHLADGTVLSGYSLSSVSGFNWNNAFAPMTSAVPEPSAVWLMGAGLLTLILVTRRNKT